MRREDKPHTRLARELFLRLHGAQVKALQDAQVLTPDWRRKPMYDLSGCRHTTQAMFSVKNDHGSWDVLICIDCGASEKHCPHEINSWNDEGTVLTCDNCGIDGT